MWARTMLTLESQCSHISMLMAGSVYRNQIYDVIYQEFLHVRPNFSFKWDVGWLWVAHKYIDKMWYNGWYYGVYNVAKIIPMITRAATHISRLKLTAPDLLVSAAPALVVLLPIAGVGEAIEVEPLDAWNAAIFSTPPVIPTWIYGIVSPIP